MPSLLGQALETISAILEVVKKLDLLPQQVLIEVLIIDLQIDEASRRGIEWILEGESAWAQRRFYHKVGSLVDSGSLQIQF